MTTTTTTTPADNRRIVVRKVGGHWTVFDRVRGEPIERHGAQWAAAWESADEWQAELEAQGRGRLVPLVQGNPPV